MLVSPLRELTALPHILQLDLRGHFEAGEGGKGKNGGKKKGQKR